MMSDRRLGRGIGHHTLDGTGFDGIGLDDHAEPAHEHVRGVSTLATLPARPRRPSPGGVSAAVSAVRSVRVVGETTGQRAIPGTDAGTDAGIAGRVQAFRVAAAGTELNERYGHSGFLLRGGWFAAGSRQVPGRFPVRGESRQGRVKRAGERSPTSTPLPTGRAIPAIEPCARLPPEYATGHRGRPSYRQFCSEYVTQTCAASQVLFSVAGWGSNDRQPCGLGRQSGTRARWQGPPAGDEDLHAAMLR